MSTISKELTLEFSHPGESNVQEADLTGRFRQLSHKRSPRSCSTPSPLTEVSRQDEEACPPSPTLEELLAELNTEEEHYRIDHNDLTEAEDLLVDAKRALPLDGATSTEPNSDREANGGQRCSSTGLPPQDGLEGERVEIDEDTEATSSLQRILDEVAIEKQHVALNDDDGQVPIAKSPEANDDIEQGGHDAGEAIPLFPSTPTHVPPKPPTDDSLFPSAPTAAPRSSASRTGPNFTDAEIDNWCIICLGDATVRCLGCAGDLYCSLCWKEGHTGPDAGYEERRHRAVALRRNKVGSM